MADELEAFHSIARATQVGVWLVAHKHFSASIDALLKIRRPEWNQPMKGTNPGNRLSWGELEPLDGPIESNPLKQTFANDEEYEMVFKTAILRENEQVIRQTEALANNVHSLALVHLHPARSLPRSAEDTTACVGWFKAYVKLNVCEDSQSGYTLAKLDAGLKVALTWPRALCQILGMPLLPTDVPLQWSGHVTESESDMGWEADLVLILKKPAKLPAPQAAEPDEIITKKHVHPALIKADLNETSAKRQFKAISTIAADPKSSLCSFLLNQQVVSPPFDSHAYDLPALAKDFIDRQLEMELNVDMKLREETQAKIEACEKEEIEAELESALVDSPSATTSDQLGHDSLGKSVWDADYEMPDLPDMPKRPKSSFGGQSSAQLRLKEKQRIKAFTEMQQVKLEEATKKIVSGNKCALRLAKSLNPQQLLAFNSSCRASPGFTLLTGPPGTGKSYLIERLVASFVGMGMNALVSAPSNDAVNVLASGLFRGANTDDLSFSNRNSLGLSYMDIVRVYPEQQETRDVRLRVASPDTDEFLLHLMREEDVLTGSQTMGVLSLAGHIRRLALSTKHRPAESDPWREYRLIVAGQPQPRSFRTCYNEIAKAVISRAKVVLATLNTCQTAVIRKNFFPSLVVVDEAAQATEPDTLIPFVRNFEQIYCRFMAGDEKQLAPTVLSKKMSEQSEQLEYSLFSRLKATGTPTCTLNEQYRMVPDISALPNARIYGKQLKDHPSTHVENRPLASEFLRFASTNHAPASNRLFYDVQHSHCLVDETTKSRYNPAHLAAIVHLLEMLLLGRRPFFRASEVNVLCFYKAQRSRLLEYLSLRALQEPTANWSNMRVCTVDSYQGKEKEIIILDLVVEGGSDVGSVGFVRDNTRLNVALSRARDGLIVVGRASGIVNLTKVRSDCLLIQLGRNVMDTAHCWRSSARTSDWYQFLDAIQPESGVKRNYSALLKSNLQPSTLDPWELEEFRTGVISENRVLTSTILNEDEVDEVDEISGKRLKFNDLLTQS